MGERKYNFNPGPAVLPLEVVEIVRDNLLDYRGTGIGVMEMSHRGAAFKELLETADKDLRDLLGMSDDFAVLFTTGGASNQFSMVPMNLLRQGEVADYIISGSWASKAFKEASKFGEVREAASSRAQNYACLPTDFDFSKNASYVHFTSNNTIYGTQSPEEPPVGNAPLVCDASSDFLHKKIPIEKYGLIYAGAQKNLGPAGVTLVIIRKDLLTRSPESLPVMMNYNTYAGSASLYNTPPVLPIYVVAEVLKWLKRIGGLAVIEQRNREKAKILYDYIDGCDFYSAIVTDRRSRSMMNVCFRLADQSLEGEFVKQAETQGLVGLKGHRSVGGLRASIYNAFPKEGVESLVSFMRSFAASH